MNEKIVGKKQLIEALNELMRVDFNQFQKKVFDVVDSYMENTPDEDRDNFQQLCYGTSLDRTIDSIGFLRSWIEDRINGKTLKELKGTRYKKMLRALGYE